MLFFSCDNEKSNGKEIESEAVNPIYYEWKVKRYGKFPEGYYLDSLFYMGQGYHLDENRDTIKENFGIATKVYFPGVIDKKHKLIECLVRMDLSHIPQSFSISKVPKSVHNIFVEFWVDDFYATDRFISFKSIKQYHTDNSSLYFHGYYGFNFTLDKIADFHFRRMILNYDQNISSICKIANKFKTIEHILVPNDINKYQNFYIKKDSLLLLFDHENWPNLEFTICDEDYFVGSYAIPLNELIPFIKQEYDFIFE